jgi:hypothetical protein
MVPASGTPAQLRNGVRALDFVLATWGPRCDVIKFFVEADPNLPATYLPNNARSADLFKTGVENPGEKGAPLVGIEMQRSGCNDRCVNPTRVHGLRRFVVLSPQRVFIKFVPK